MHRKYDRSSIQLQDRDISLLQNLFESRVMTLEHLATHHFAGRFEAAKKRVHKLKRAQFIAERPRQNFEPAVHYLTRRGIEFLGERGVLACYPPCGVNELERRAAVSDATIDHELDVVAIKVAFHAAARAMPAIVMREFVTWPRLVQFTAGNSLVKPDGFLRWLASAAGLPSEKRCFLELDRSTESQRILLSKVSAYEEYYRSGDFALRHGGKRAQYRKLPFSTLVVFKSAERRDNFARRFIAQQKTGLRRFWLCTYAEIREDPLGQIWTRPCDYLSIPAGRPSMLHSLL